MLWFGVSYVSFGSAVRQNYRFAWIEMIPWLLRNRHVSLRRPSDWEIMHAYLAAASICGFQLSPVISRTLSLCHEGGMGANVLQCAWVKNELGKVKTTYLTSHVPCGMTAKILPSCICSPKRDTRIR